MMPFNLFFMLFILCISVLCNHEQRIRQLKALVKKEGWSRQKHILQIRENEKYHDVHNLFTPNAIEITAANIDEKLRRVHTFLSCDYAVLLIEYCDYVKTLGQECKKQENPFELFNCLEQYHQKLIDSNPWIVRMIGAFSYFVKLSQNTKFNRQVPEILYYLKNYYDTKVINTSEFENNGNIKRLKVHVRIQDIDDLLTNVVSFSQMFLKGNCLLKSNYDKIIDVLLLSTSPVESPSIIVETIDKCIDLFRKLHYEEYGFIFDEISQSSDVEHSSRIEMEDEESHKEMLTEQFDKFNKILSNPAWSKPWNDIYGIVEPGFNYPYTELFAMHDNQKLVHPDNYDTIIRRAHHSLSCNFARSLKEHVEYAYGLSFQCDKTVDHSDIKKFFTFTIEDGKKMLLSMKYSFLSFDQLSQDIVFNTNISVVVDYMLCYYDQVKFNNPSFFYDELEYSKFIMFFVERFLRLFLEEFCWSCPYYDITNGISEAISYTLTMTQPSKYPKLEYRLLNIHGEIRRIANAFSNQYQQFGFGYDLSFIE